MDKISGKGERFAKVARMMRLYFRYAFLAVLLLTSVPYIKWTVEPYLKIFLVWGAVCVALEIISTVLKETRTSPDGGSTSPGGGSTSPDGGSMLLNRGSTSPDKSRLFLGMGTASVLMLMCFCLMYLISIIINREHGFSANTGSLLYMAAVFLVCYGDDRSRDKEAVRTELAAYLRIMSVGTFFLSAVCFATYILKINVMYLRGDRRGYLGYWDDRLWGLYNANTGGFLCAISIIISVIFMIGYWQMRKVPKKTDGSRGKREAQKRTERVTERQAETKTEIKTDTKAESKTETKTEIKIDTKAESKTETKIKTDTRAESKTGIRFCWIGYDCLNIVLQTTCLALTYSRTSILVLAFGIMLLVWFLLAYKTNDKSVRRDVSGIDIIARKASDGKSAAVKLAIAMLAAAAVVAVCLGLHWALEKIYVKPNRNPIAITVSAGDEVVYAADKSLAVYEPDDIMDRFAQVWDGEIIEVGAVEQEERAGGDGMLTGRPLLWNAGWKTFLQNPLFGVTRENLYIKTAPNIAVPGWEEDLAAGGVHNGPLTVLISSGLAGFAFMAAFAVMLFAQVLHALTRIYVSNGWDLLFVGVAVLIVVILASELTEARILYQVNVFFALFWTLCGYAATLISK